VDRGKSQETTGGGAFYLGTAIRKGSRLAKGPMNKKRQVSDCEPGSGEERLEPVSE